MEKELFNKRRGGIILLEYLNLEEGKKCSISQFKEKFGKNFTNIKNWLEREGYIKKEKYTYRITNRGVHFISRMDGKLNLEIQTKILEKQSFLTTLSIIISILLSSVTIIVAYQQYTLSEIELIPNEARLEIFLNVPTQQDILSIPINNINRPERHKIELFVINGGRIPSGPINVKIEENWLQENYGYIENVPPADFDYVELYLKNALCDGHSDCPKLDQDFEPGIRELKVSITCNTCKKKEEIKTFKLCFVNNKFSEQQCSTESNIKD